MYLAVVCVLGVCLEGQAQIQSKQEGLILMRLGNADDVGTLVFSPDGRQLLSAGKPDKAGHYTISCWNIKTKTLMWQCDSGFTQAVTNLAFAKDGKRFVAGSFRGEIGLFDSQGKIESRFRLVEEPATRILCLAFTGDGNVLAIGERGFSELFGPNNDSTSFRLGAPIGELTAATSSQWCQRVAYASNHLVVVDSDVLKKRINSFPVRATGELTIKACALSDDGSHFLAAGEGGTFVLINVAKGKIIKEWGGDDLNVLSAIAFPGNRGFVTSDAAGRIRFWDNLGQKINEIRAPRFDVGALSISSDGSMLATGGEKQQIVVWDAAKCMGAP